MSSADESSFRSEKAEQAPHMRKFRLQFSFSFAVWHLFGGEEKTGQMINKGKRALIKTRAEMYLARPSSTDGSCVL